MNETLTLQLLGSVEDKSKQSLKNSSTKNLIYHGQELSQGRAEGQLPTQNFSLPPNKFDENAGTLRCFCFEIT